MPQIVFPRGEIGHASIATNATGTNTAAANVVGLSSTVVAGSRAFMVTCKGFVVHSAASSRVQLTLSEDGVVVDSVYITSVGAGSGAKASLEARRSPAAGSHTYTVQAYCLDAGTWTLIANASYQCNLEVIEV